MIPDLSVAWVVFFVLVLAVVLDRPLFKPVARVVLERERDVESASELARTSLAQSGAAASEFEACTLFLARPDVR